jgi:hypothetical protein
MQQAPMRGVPGSFSPKEELPLPWGFQRALGPVRVAHRALVKSWDLVIPQPLTCAYPVHCHFAG